MRVADINLHATRIMRVTGVLLVCTLLLTHVNGQDKKDAIAVTAEALGQEYDKNPKATHKKYDGKVLEITGSVKYTMHIVAPMVSLEGSKKATWGIACQTKDKQPWASFTPGQKVKVVGTYRAGFGGPDLRGCEVTALEPNTATVLTSEALAKEFAASKQAAEKYEKKTIIVTGTITKSEYLPGGGFTDITLDGAGKTGVIVRMHNSQGELGKTLKAGQSITLSGPFSYVDGANVRIDTAFPVKKDAAK